MKKLLVALLLLPVMAFAQSQKDYGLMMGKFMGYYNRNNPEKLLSLFPEQSRAFAEAVYTKKSIEDGLGKRGRIKSFKYLGIDKTDRSP